MSLKPVLLQFKFKDFEGLPSGPGQLVLSEELAESNGNAWKLDLYPGGYRREDEGWISLFLENNGKNDVWARYSIILRNASGAVYDEVNSITPYLFSSEGDAEGVLRLQKRSEILDEKNNILSDGALFVDFSLQFKEPSSPHYPPSSLSMKMLQVLHNVDDADVAFKVGDDTVTAHKAILRMNAPVLFDCCDENNDGLPVTINDITPEIFRILLRYVYGDEVPDSTEIVDEGKCIITAADRFGIVGLKLAVEAVLVESLVIHKSNVADWLVFADSKTCPLLKEHATAYFASRSVDILNCDTSKQLKESPKLLTELMIEITKSSSNNRFGDENNVSVNDLRKQLYERGLDVDGSKEMLISCLQESNKKQRNE